MSPDGGTLMAVTCPLSASGRLFAYARPPQLRCRTMGVDSQCSGDTPSVVCGAPGGCASCLDFVLYIGRVRGVTRSRRPSPQTVSVLDALAADPTAWRYGYELGVEVGLRSGSLYPIL